MFEITAYKCEHCRKKIYQSKSSAKKHEKICWWNEDVKACMTCMNYMSPDDDTQLKVVNGDYTICAYADEETGFNSKCSGWRKYTEFE